MTHRPRVPEEPETWRALSRAGAVGLVLATRDPPSGEGRAFRDRESVLDALARDEIALSDTVRVGSVTTTAGRFLARECVPPSARSRMGEGPWSAHALCRALDALTRDESAELAARCADALESLGQAALSRSGLSVGMDDLAPPAEKAEIVTEFAQQARDIETDFTEGLITARERYLKLVDVWSHGLERLRWTAGRERDACGPLYALSVAWSAVPAWQNPRLPRGLLSDRHGEIRELPVLHSAAEGVTAHEAMMLYSDARHRALKDRHRAREADALWRDLDAALGDITVVTRDCGTVRGRTIRADDAVTTQAQLPFSTRLEDRVLAREVIARDGSVVARAGALVTRAVARAIEAAAVPAVELRDVLGCEAEGGVCAVCYGLDRDATWAAEGEPVGARAAWAVAVGSVSFDLRTFHIC